MDQQRVIAAWVEKAGRRRVQWPIVVRSRNGEPIQAELSEVTSDGCQVRLAHPLEVGEHVVLVHTELGGVRAEVRWWTAGRSGMRFTTGALPVACNEPVSDETAD